MTLISVIIPIYNTESYLSRCLDSVLNQTLEDFEVICINDGSTDNSLNILEEYAQRDSRVVVVNQETNGGVSQARNIGIKKSKSPYIFFLDSDDFLEPNSLELLYTAAINNNADITFGATNFYSNDCYDGHDLIAIQEFSEKILDKNLYYHLVTIRGKLFSKKIIDKHSIKFHEDLITSEDFIFSFTCICHNAKIFPLAKITYNYTFFRKNSATSNLKQNNTELLGISYFISTESYKNATKDNKILFVNICMHNALFWHNIYHGKNSKAYLRKIFKYLKNNIPKEIILECPHYKTINSISKTTLQNIFSIESWKRLIKRKLLKK